MNGNDTAFGLLLREARSQRKMTQADVAEALGLTAEYYARVERGHARCSVVTFAAMRRILGFDANALLGALGETSAPIVHTSRAVRKRPHDTGGPYIAFARELRSARYEHQFTQEAVAMAIDCGDKFYQRVEVGQAMLSLALFARLHHCLGFDANHLLDTLPPLAASSRPARYARFGALLARSRDAAGKGLAVAADAAACSVEDYRRLEMGKRLPTLVELVRLHRLLGFRADTALHRIPLDQRTPDKE